MLQFYSKLRKKITIGQWVAFTLCLLVAYTWRDIVFYNLDYSLRNTDNLHAHFPFFCYWRDEIERRGFLPAWNPLIWGGMPSMGDPNIPFNILLWPLFYLSRSHLVMALNWLQFFEYLAATLGFYCLARRLGLKPILSGAGALFYIWSTSAAITAQIFTFFFHFAVIPWVLVILLSQRLGLFARLLAIASLSYLQFTYGQQQMTFYSAIFLLFAVSYFFRDRFEVKKTLSTLLLGYGLGTVLAAHYLLPFFEFVSWYKDRANPNWSEIIQLNKVSFSYLLNLLIPRAFAQKDRWWPIWRDGWSFFESYFVYASSLVFLLFLFGLRRFRDASDEGRSIRRLWIFALALIFLNSTYWGGVLQIGLNVGRTLSYGRSSHFLLFPILWIALWELQSIQEQRKLRRHFGLFLILIAVVLLFSTQTTVINRYVENFFNQVIAIPIYHHLWLDPRTAAGFTGLVSQQLMLTAALSVCLGGLFLLWSVGPVKVESLWLFCILGFALVDAYQVQDLVRVKGTNPFPYTNSLEVKNPVIDYLKTRPDWDRYLFYYLLGERESRTGLTPNQSALAHIPSINGYTSIVPRLSDIEPRYDRSNYGFDVYSQSLLRLLSIKYIYVDNLDRLDQKIPREAILPKIQFDRGTLVEYRDAVPRYFFPEKVEAAQSSEDLVAKLNAPNLDPQKVSYQSSKSARFSFIRPSDCHPAYQITNSELDSPELTIENNCLVSVPLAINLPHHPWWKFYLDHQPTESQELNLIQRVVDIPPGRHQWSALIVPKTWYWGQFLSCCGLMLVIIGGLLQFVYLKKAAKKRSLASDPASP